jgi:hypothetical protein
VPEKVLDLGAGPEIMIKTGTGFDTQDGLMGISMSVAEKIITQEKRTWSERPYRHLITTEDFSNPRDDLMRFLTTTQREQLIKKVNSALGRKRKCLTSNRLRSLEFKTQT